jgi:hypothetical protein
MVQMSSCLGVAINKRQVARGVGAVGYNRSKRLWSSCNALGFVACCLSLAIQSAHFAMRRISFLSQ